MNIMASIPRAVVVRRPTDYELLLERHSTRGQATFFLRAREQSIEPVDEAHERFESAYRTVVAQLPRHWRRAEITRRDLAHFLFEPNDMLVAVGQDGLVANVAKYLDGQLVVGVNSDPERFDGVLVRACAEGVGDWFERIASGNDVQTERRTMVRAQLDDGQELHALNELFVGQRTHQSARYRLMMDGREERQSSSGLIVTTGTGATGWARSINLSRGEPLKLPEPTESAMAFFVREAFPSIATGVEITHGRLADAQELVIVSEMNEDGVVFGDGIEADRVPFGWGQRVRIRTSDRSLLLAVG
jgi:NAD kinase